MAFLFSITDPHMKRNSRKDNSGFTLIEALLASVVLAATVTAITVPFTLAGKNQQIDIRRTLAVALAEELMEEILSREFCESDETAATHLGPDAGETDRCLFDNVDDYHACTEPPGSIANVEGQLIDVPGARDLSRHVTTQYVYLSGQDTSATPSFIRVTVEVRYRGEPVVKLTRLVYELPNQ